MGMAWAGRLTGMDLEENPLGKQAIYWNLNASVRLGDVNDRWRLSLIGTNLANTYRSQFVSPAGFSGNAAFTGTNTPGRLPDLHGLFAPGRQVRLVLEVNFN